ncbi:MAG: acetyltransferase [Proteobacteria bacterium]|nr:acetyltransferase [Pseudomonadota bacterium]
MQNRLRSTRRRLAIFGAGGHGRELAWLAELVGWKRSDLCFVVDKPAYRVKHVNGLAVCLLDDAIALGEEAGYVVALGDALARERSVILCERAGLTPVSLIHPGIELSPSVNIGQGSVICAGTILTTNIHIGRHVHINIGCTISHDAEVAEFATLSPGVHIAGHVSVGRRAFIGIGAVIINGSENERLVIGDDAVIAAGACVTCSVEAGAMVAGVPAVSKR